jgi:hypothetical protein
MAVLLPALLAVAFLGVILQDAFEVMLLPRRVQRQLRLVGLFFRSTWFVWSSMAIHLPNGSRREHILSLYGPLSIVLLFVTWSMSLIGSFGVLEWALQTAAGVHPPPTLGEELYMSGVTFFTLGYGEGDPAHRGFALPRGGRGGDRTGLACRRYRLSPGAVSVLGDRLPHAAYVGIERCFEEAGLSWKAGPAAEETLAALRATYEPLLKGLSSYLLLPLPGWAADPAAGDHWERGPRGLIARRLVKDLAERPDRPSAPDATVEPGARWRRLRRRLRPDG